MPYTRAWSDAVLGTNPANTIDTLLANIRQDLNERLTDVLGISSFTADPLVPTSLKLNRAAATKILGGTTSLSVRNAADTLDNLLVDNATGNLTVRGGVTAVSFTGNGANLTSLNLSNLNATNLTSGTIPEARFPTNLTLKGTVTIRNAADTSNNLKVWDSGVISTRGYTGTGAEDAGSLVIGNGGIVDSKLFMMDIFGSVTKALEMSNGPYLKLLGALQTGHVLIPTTPTTGSFPAAGANGIIGMDSSNGRFVWYVNGGRFYVLGTPF